MAGIGTRDCTAAPNQFRTNGFPYLLLLEDGKMKHWMKTTVCAGLLAGVALASTPANAQGPRDMMPGMGMFGMGYGMMSSGCPGYGPGMAGGGPGRGMMGGPGMMSGRGYDAAKADELLDERLDALETELGIGEKQEDAWKAYEEAVKARFTTMRGMHESMHTAMTEGSAIERMEIRIGMMENMLDSMKALVPAIKALYEVLPEEKKTAADSWLGGCAGY